MALFLQVDSLTKSFGARMLFKDISFGINQGERIGLIAANGTGKTTLLNILAEKEDYLSGDIVFRSGVRIGYLEQNPEFPAHLTALEASFYSEDPIVETIKEYEKAIISGDDKLLSKAIEQMDAKSAWNYEQEAKQILTQLKITDLSQPIGKMSGGELKRIALANALIREPELLIMDEPTNHLDIEMIEWLEKYLAQGNVTLLMVTHDRYFLDRVCNRIIEIDNQQLYTYNGNYSYYVEKRQERIELTNTMAEKNQNLYRRELEWMRSTPSARTGKAKYRIDAFNELSKQRRTHLTTENVRLGIEASRIGTKIFELKNISKSYGSKKLLDNFSYLFSRGEKLGIVGDNGVGKSTLIKILLGEVAADSGTIDIGETVRFGYYSQQGLSFDEEMRVIDVVKEISEDIEMSDGSRLTASQLLQQFLFTPESQYDFVRKLSGGERRRLYLCTILMTNPNFLILDEPTNDLDIQTLNVLEEYLENYNGCVIVISHDRYFMDKVVDHIFAMEGDTLIKDYPGGYSDYRTWRAEELAQQEQNSEANLKKNRGEEKRQRSRTEVARRLTFNEKREFESLGKEIPKLEQQKAEMERRMSSGELSSEKLLEISHQITELIEELDNKSMTWLELSELEG